MSDDDLERSLRQAAKENRERLAAAHRGVVRNEEAKKALDIRQNMARLKELRLAKEAQETRTKIAKENSRARLKPERFK